jgi:hypothetical protein
LDKPVFLGLPENVESSRIKLAAINGVRRFSVTRMLLLLVLIAGEQV